MPTISIPNYLVVGQKMNGGLAHDLTKLLFEHGDELVAAHPESRDLDPARARWSSRRSGCTRAHSSTTTARAAVTV